MLGRAGRRARNFLKQFLLIGLMDLRYLVQFFLGQFFRPLDAKDLRQLIGSVRALRIHLNTLP